MGAWGDIELSWKFAIVLGSAIALTFFAGLVKLVVVKRRLARDQKLEDIEAAEKSENRVALNHKTLGEGDLFGVRAIQSGFYGGVSQISLTPPSSSASSLRTSPTGDSSDSNASLRSTSTELSVSKPWPSTTLSQSSLRKARPTPINSRLQPSDAELNGRMNHDPAMRVRTYTPTSPRSPMSFESDTNGISRSPTLLAQRQKLVSLLEGTLVDENGLRLILPPETQATLTFVSTPNNPTANIRSEAASISKLSLPSRPDLAALRSPTLSLFPNNSLRREHIPILTPRQSSKDNNAHDVPPVPHSLRVPAAPLSPSSPSIQLRAISGVSDWSDTLIQELATQKRKTQLSHMSVRIPSGYPSSLSSTSLHNDEPTSSDETVRSYRRRSRSQDFNYNRHTRQSSRESTSSSRERGIKRSQNSIRHSHKHSAESTSMTAASKSSRRRSIQRDAMHYDPSGHRRTPSGSILARRPVDFDHPRSSPFSPFDDKFAISVSPSTNTTPLTRNPIAKSSGSGSERNAAVSDAEKLSVLPAVREGDDDGREPSTKLVEERSWNVGRNKVSSGGGKHKQAAMSRSEVMEAYYRAARLSRSYGASNDSSSTPEPTLETAGAEAGKSQEKGGQVSGPGKGKIDEGVTKIRSRIPVSGAKRPDGSRIGSSFTARGYRKIGE